MTLTFHSGLSKDFSSILDDADDFNVIIQVGKNKNTKEFHAHSVILRARSPFFKNALSSDLVTKKNNMIIFNKPNIAPSVFDIILKYIYTGELDLTKQSSEDILELLVSLDEFLIEELVLEHVQDYLIENKSTWIQQNFVLVLHFAFKLASCKKLQDYCLTSPLLVKDILFGLFKHDDFQMEDIVAWDFLIKWGIKQTPELVNKNDQNEWTDENYEDLKNILSDFIPLINFSEITSKDFHYKVRPYKAIVPNNIYEEAMTHYLVEQPNEKDMVIRNSHILMPTNIIKPNIANIIANWIDRIDTGVLSLNHHYKFNLIYLMSRDGFDCTTFYNKCNGQGPFIVLVKVQSKKIYGGYNPIGYAGRLNQWLSSTESFTFSFEDDQDMHNMKISRVINASFSAYDHIIYENFFNFGYQLTISSNKNLCISSSSHYDNTIYNNNVGTNLPIEEIEVFSVVKKF